MPGDSIGRLLSHARQRGYSAVVNGCFQRLDAVDTQFFSEKHCRLWADTRYRHQVQNTLRQLGQKILMGGNLTGGKQFPYLFANSLANTWDCFEVGAFLHRFIQREGQVFDGPGRPLVGTNLEYGVTLHLQKDGHIFEKLSYFIVIYWHRHLRFGDSWGWSHAQSYLIITSLRVQFRCETVVEVAL